ncbi:proton-translocating transhydrogenase family protein [Legionella sp. D16C41]|uniref:proton-translocating transhydrogenase family protein n=1 Tax=Legionella sp. D16C41 TaxID=3402688 RepID=UPI003AF530A8
MLNHTVTMNDYIAILTIFILACFVGYYVIWKVTPALHTPLMSVTNAISSIIILGALIAAGSTALGTITILGGIAIFVTAINIFGGFVVTQRMLRMYKK